MTDSFEGPKTVLFQYFGHLNEYLYPFVGLSRVSQEPSKLESIHALGFRVTT